MLILVPTSLEMAALFPEATADALRSGRFRTGRHGEVARCGMGLASAGARAASLLASHRGDAALVGVAGSHDLEVLPLAAVFMASTVDVDGIGFGEGDDFVDPTASPTLAAEVAALPAAAPWLPDLDIPRCGLLSVAAASATRAVAARRQRLYPRAMAEDMEAHAVLHAAAATGHRVAVLRAVSNEVGDRDPARWAIPQAARALRTVLDAWLGA